MTAYELGIEAARHAGVPGHLKQAYARGFAGAFGKKAPDAQLRKMLASLPEEDFADLEAFGEANPHLSDDSLLTAWLQHRRAQQGAPAYSASLHSEE